MGPTSFVLVPPQFKVMPTDIDTVANKDVKMLCEVTGNPKPKISWYKNGNIEEVQVEHIEVTDNEITIMEVLESDGGMYQCFAENRGGEIMASAQLNIYGKDFDIQRLTYIGKSQYIQTEI